MTKVLGLFPGQGSQRVGMGLELFKTSEKAQEIFAIADAALGFKLSQICFEGPAEQLTATEIAQPAILTVSTVAYEISQLDPTIAPQLCAAAGHSLGEYSALVAAGALSFKDAVVLVHKRGRYMQEAVPAGIGKMYAILGKELIEIEDACAKVTAGVAEIANVNAPGQIVIAGDAAGTAQLLSLLGTAKSIELQVSAPFHCSLMKPASDKLAKDLALIPFQAARFPVFANCSARPVTTPEEIRQSLELQVCGRVRWVECMQNAIAVHEPDKATEFGTSTVLTGLLKRIHPSLPRENYPK